MLEVYALNVAAPLDAHYKAVFLEQVSKEKRQQVARFRREIDGRRTLMGELLMKVMLAKHLKTRARQITFKVTEYGKPYLEGNPLYFNISHSGQWVVGAISDCLVGVDVEEIKQADLGIAKRFFTEVEYSSLVQINNGEKQNEAFYKLWSGKESYIKMIGKGLTIPLNAFTLAYAEGGLELIDAYEGRMASFRTYPLYKGRYSFVVCSEKKMPYITYKQVDYSMIEHML